MPVAKNVKVIAWMHAARKAKCYKEIAGDREAERITWGHLPVSWHVKILIFELLTSNGLCKNV